MVITVTVEWISSKPASSEYITIDNQQRLYLSRGAEALIGVACPASLYVGYDKVNRRIIVAKPGIVRPTDVLPFNFDKRRYAHAKQFVRTIGNDPADLPMRYEYVGKDHAIKGAHAFQLTGYDAPDHP